MSSIVRGKKSGPGNLLEDLAGLDPDHHSRVATSPDAPRPAWLLRLAAFIPGELSSKLLSALCRYLGLGALGKAKSYLDASNALSSLLAAARNEVLTVSPEYLSVTVGAMRCLLFASDLADDRSDTLELRFIASECWKNLVSVLERLLSTKHGSLVANTLTLIGAFLDSVFADHSAMADQDLLTRLSEFFCGFLRTALSTGHPDTCRSTVDCFQRLAEQDGAVVEACLTKSPECLRQLINAILEQLVTPDFRDKTLLCSFLQQILDFQQESSRLTVQNGLSRVKGELIEAAMMAEGEAQAFFLRLIADIVAKNPRTFQPRDIDQLFPLIFSDDDAIAGSALDIWGAQVGVSQLTDGCSLPVFSSFVGALTRIEDWRADEFLQRLKDRFPLRSVALQALRHLEVCLSENPVNYPKQFLSRALAFINVLETDELRFREHLAASYARLYPLCQGHRVEVPLVRLVLRVVPTDDRLIDFCVGLVYPSSCYHLTQMAMEHLVAHQSMPTCARRLEELMDAERDALEVFRPAECLTSQNVMGLWRLQFLCRAFFREVRWIPMDKISDTLDLYMREEVEVNCAQAIPACLDIHLSNLKHHYYVLTIRPRAEFPVLKTAMETARDRCLYWLKNFADYKPRRTYLSKLAKQRLRSEAFRRLIRAYVLACNDNVALFRALSHPFSEEDYRQITLFINNAHTRRQACEDFGADDQGLADRLPLEDVDALKRLTSLDSILDDTILVRLVRDCHDVFTKPFGLHLFIVMLWKGRSPAVEQFVLAGLTQIATTACADLHGYTLQRFLFSGVRDCGMPDVFPHLVRLFCVAVNNVWEAPETTPVGRAKSSSEIVSVLEALLDCLAGEGPPCPPVADGMKDSFRLNTLSLFSGCLDHVWNRAGSAEVLNKLLKQVQKCRETAAGSPTAKENGVCLISLEAQIRNAADDSMRRGVFSKAKADAERDLELYMGLKRKMQPRKVTEAARENQMVLSFLNSSSLPPVDFVTQTNFKIDKKGVVK